MTETAKHTPGPWIVAPCSHGGMLLQRGSEDIRHRHLQSSLQIVPEADALLIAAAPDMLAALKECANVIKDFDGGDQSSETGWKNDDLLDAWIVARDAIAKATGSAL